MPRTRLFLVVIAALAVFACGDNGPSEPPAVPSTLRVEPGSLVLADGDSAQLAATVLDQNGQVLGDVAVTWTSSAPAVAGVDSDGTVVGNRPGEATITATAAGLSATTRVTVEPVPTELREVRGSGQTAEVAQPLPDSLRVRVLDRHGDPVAGVQVRFEVVQGGGSIAPSSTTSDAQGLAAAQWTLGPEPGPQTARGLAAGDSVLFTATATAPPEPEDPPSGACTQSDALSLQVGQAVTLAGAEAARICVNGTGATAEYTVVPFLASEVRSATVELAVVGQGVQAPVGPPNPARTAAAVPVSSADFGFAERWEHELRERERRELGPRIAAARADRALLRSALAARVPQAGDRLRLNVAASCSQPDYHTGRVVAVSERAIIVSDTANPAGFTDADLEQIGSTFDSLVYPVDVRNFGEPTDIDDNARVIIFYTRAVNERTPADSESFIGGFFWTGDLIPQTQCAGSNGAEIFYMLAPDPQGEVNGNVRTREFVQRVTIPTIAHEFQHLINAGRRIYVNNASSLEEVWLNEALSHIAEELLFYEVTPLEPRSNIGLETLRSSQQILDAVNQFQLSNLGRYRSYLADPQAAALIGQDDLPTRGASWAFLRYAADRESGPDAQFFFDLVNSTAVGLQNLAQQLPQPPLLWMQEWTASVYADDAVPGVPPALEQPSWNFRSVIPAIDPGDAFPLAVITIAESEEVRVALRAGGAAFLRFGVAPGASATIRNSVGGVEPPGTLRVSVLRTR